MNIKVKKRNGKLEDLNFDKIHKVLYWATEGIKNVNVSDIEVNAELHLYDGISTNEIHEVLIKSASELISVQHPNYQIVAGRLLMHLLRKNVFNTVKKVPHIKNIIKKNVEIGVYDKILLDIYNEEELDTINDIIDHSRDFELTYAGAKQLLDKYLIQDRSSDLFYETPQFAFMLIGMVLFQKYEGNERLQYVRKFYNAVSKFKINLPTPVMCGVRTPNRQYSSCTLIDIGDNLDSIIHSDAAITKYTSRRAGIGLNVGRIRAVGSKIRGGEVVSTGVIPYLKKFTASTRCCTQNGVRGGNATAYYPFWHLEVEDLLVLKNNKGSEDNRVRTMDYSIQLNKLFYKRVQEKQHITLFSPNEVPDLYESFSGNSDKFEQLYLACEDNPKLKKRKINALDFFKSICSERVETGRIYVMNIDHCNTHGSFKDPIYMSNLCAEIVLPTYPIQHIDDGDDTESEIALCVLAALNFGTIKLNEIPGLCQLLVRALDFIIDHQDYPIKAAEKMKKRRSIGVGIINLAYFFAKRKLSYEDPEALTALHEYVESYQYHLLKASNDLAKERGSCEWFHKTKYSDGILPIDTYNKNLDKICPNTLKQDWEGLRKCITEHGLANSALTAIMPSESSAVISGSTNGIEPPRDLISYKKSKKSKLPCVVPDIDKYGAYYTKAFDMESNIGYLNICGVIQKFIDQAISVNTYYVPNRYEDGNLPISIVMKDLFHHYSIGGKTLYYANTDDGKEEEKDETIKENEESQKYEDDCAGGACKL